MICPMEDREVDVELPESITYSHSYDRCGEFD